MQATCGGRSSCMACSHHRARWQMCASSDDGLVRGRKGLSAPEKRAIRPAHIPEKSIRVIFRESEQDHGRLSG